METHGITPEIIENKPFLKETTGYKKLLEENNEENYLIIHNAPFDIGMLEKEGFENKMKLIDTLRCAKHLYPDSEAHRLQYFRYSLGIYKKEQEEANKLNIEIKAHDAIGDVLILKLFMSELVKKVKEKYPQNNPMEKLVELTKKIPLIKIMPFGKHKGMEIKEVIEKDIGWVNWALSNMEDMNEELKYTLEYWLKENEKDISNYQNNFLN